jgi:hypothetical protein
VDRGEGSSRSLWDWLRDLELLQQRVELEFGIQATEARIVSLFDTESFDIRPYRHVSADRHELPAQPCIVGLAQ